MRLVQKKVLFYLFINCNLAIFKVHPLCLHTPFPAVLPLFVVFLERILWDVVLRPAWQTSGWLLLTENGVLSLPILLFEIKGSRKMRDQVSKEAAASP
jgi:hypothetical protein